ncbi:unnamed protein product [Protopolystoma xenopodis]|uniref:Uncharacterized protein n=1 Tax=Protopolystoma xenopodis TaxID=117903 RepID=A0A3S5AHD2_9PLAT|nr:unnamed protein product [Protopolystoma xenopodis]
MSGVLWSKNRALVFGGLNDVEDAAGEMIRGYFHNDLYVVELDKAKWHTFRYESLPLARLSVPTSDRQVQLLNERPNQTGGPVLPDVNNSDAAT